MHGYDVWHHHPKLCLWILGQEFRPYSKNLFLYSHLNFTKVVLYMKPSTKIGKFMAPGLGIQALARVMKAL